MPAFSVTDQALTTCTVQLPQSRNVLPPRDYLVFVLILAYHLRLFLWHWTLSLCCTEE